MRTGTWTDLTSNGHLALIEDPDVRDALLAHYELVVPINASLIRRRETLFATQLKSQVLHHVDGRALYGNAASDSARSPIVTSWDAFRNEPDVGGLLRTRSAQGTDRVRVYETQVLPAVQCLLLRLSDTGVDSDPESDDENALRDWCTENGI